MSETPHATTGAMVLVEMMAGLSARSVGEQVRQLTIFSKHHALPDQIKMRVYATLILARSYEASLRELHGHAQLKDERNNRNAV